MAGFIDNVEIDLITNGRGQGEMASQIANGRFSTGGGIHFDPGLLRPVIQTDGKKYCRIQTGGMVQNKKDSANYNPNRPEHAMVTEHEYVPLQTLINSGIVPQTHNASALPYQAWQEIDRTIIRASRKRLQAWSDLESAETYTIDGMGTTGLIRDTMTDPGDAKIDMDAVSNDMNDAPLFTSDILPLPIIHAGAFITQRRKAMFEKHGQPFDMMMIEMAGRRCGETLEKMTLGTLDLSSTFSIGSDTTFGNNDIYGYRTQPHRIKKTDITSASTVTPSAFMEEVLAMIELARAQNFFGPFVLFCSNSFRTLLAQDYYKTVTAAGITDVSRTVRERIQAIDEIARVSTPDYFDSTDELLLVELGSETIRAVNGMDFTPVMWEAQGGAKTMIRVMGIKVPDLRSQYIGTDVTEANRKSAIVHGTTV